VELREFPYKRGGKERIKREVRGRNISSIKYKNSIFIFYRPVIENRPELLSLKFSSFFTV
jgi:hypothetical protein